MPEPTGKSAPVVLAERGDASRATTSATSWGDANRPVARPIASGASVVSTVSRSLHACAAMMSAAPPSSVHHGVSTGPGETVLTRMPRGANSSDSALVRLLRPALAELEHRVPLGVIGVEE